MPKRELIDTGTDKRFVQRNKQGPIQGVGRRRSFAATGRQAPTPNRCEGWSGDYEPINNASGTVTRAYFVGQQK